MRTLRRGWRERAIRLRWPRRERGDATARVPPRVDLNLSAKGAKGEKRRNPKKGDAKRKGGSGHAFSAANPYGAKKAGDARQFSY